MMYVGIPLTSALAVTHGYLPPHPAPASVAVLFHADMNLTLLYGLILSIPAMLLAGPFLARFARGMSNKPPASLFVERKFDREALPGLGLSLFTTLIPVMLMLGGAVVSLSTPENSALRPAAKFLSDPNIALFLAAMIALYTLGLRRGRTMEALMGSVGKAAASVSMVILIIAAGGAFKQVLIDCGTAEMIKGLATQAKISPIVLAWGMAALLRAALGSATVAAITASGMLLPVVAASGVRPELLVIATTSGSLMFSHFNDIGFWMFKEYYNCTVKQTFQIWSVMEGIVAVIGLLGALAFNAI
jgi:gluconate transporter